MLEQEINQINKRIDRLENPHKRKLFISITKKKDWYLKVSFDTFITILMDLDYSKEEAIKIFKKINVGE